MPAVNDLITRVFPTEPPVEDTALTLGLPLETEEKTIYPVFQESRTESPEDRRLRQIGYLEIGEGRSDYISLEPASRGPVALLGLIALLITLAWAARRFRG